MQLPAWMWGVVLLCFCVAIFYRNKHKDDDHDDNEDRRHRRWQGAGKGFYQLILRMNRYIVKQNLKE